MINRNFKKNKKQKGFVLLFAVLISTLVLAVGISMISIALKQVVLSGSGRDSEYAFYASNTGAECATYWDLASSSVFTTATIPGANVRCLGHALASKWTLDNGILVAGALETTSTCNPNSADPSTDQDWCFYDNGSDLKIAKFRIAYSDKPYCADVIVKKDIDTTTGLVATTTVTSRGYNSCDTANPRRIERALEFSY